MARLYRLKLDDYSAASFTSFSKNYFGTLEQLKGLFDGIRSDKKNAESFSDILSVFDRYLAGEKNLTHNVAYQEIPFLVHARAQWKIGTDGYAEEYECISGSSGRSLKQGWKT